MASNRKGARNQHEFLMILPNYIFFKTSKYSNIRPKIIEFKNLEDSEVHSCELMGLKNLSSLIDLSGLCNLTGLNSL